MLRLLPPEIIIRDDPRAGNNRHWIIFSKPIGEPDMDGLHEARYYQTLPGKQVLCTLCPHDCRIVDGGRGACGVRYNHNGKLYTLVYDKVVSRNVEPVEKKPLVSNRCVWAVSAMGISCFRALFTLRDAGSQLDNPAYQTAGFLNLV